MQAPFPQQLRNTHRSGPLTKKYIREMEDGMSITSGSHDGGDDAARVWQMMEQIDTCMLASHDGDRIHARPMHARPRESERAVYFLTSTQGAKDEEILHDEHVCLSFADPSDGKYLTVQGMARVLEDRELIRALWNTAAQTWWSGPDDPQVRVIEVTPDSAEFWDRPHGFVHRVQMSIAAASPLPANMGEQGKVDLH